MKKSLVPKGFRAISEEVKSNYTKVPNELITAPMDANAKCILIYLLSNRQEFVYYKESIAEQLQMSRTTVFDKFTQLIEDGFLVELVPAANKTRLVYRLTLEPLAEWRERPYKICTESEGKTDGRPYKIRTTSYKICTDIVQNPDANNTKTCLQDCSNKQNFETGETKPASVSEQQEQSNPSIKISDTKQPETNSIETKATDTKPLEPKPSSTPTSGSQPSSQSFNRPKGTTSFLNGSAPPPSTDGTWGKFDTGSRNALVELYGVEKDKAIQIGFQSISDVYVNLKSSKRVQFYDERLKTAYTKMASEDWQKILAIHFALQQVKEAKQLINPFDLVTSEKPGNTLSAFLDEYLYPNIQKEA